MVEKKLSSKKDSVKKSSASKKGVKKKSIDASAVKKSAPKKSSTKKKVTKAQKVKAVRKNAPTQNVFVMVNGHKIKNVKELADVLEKIEDHVFNHHVNEDKHDFAKWLHDVFEEVGLAKELAHVKDKDHMQLVLYKHISHKLW